jgi:UDP-N-acetyl-D-glucosamine dehydrogenase
VTTNGLRPRESVLDELSRRIEQRAASIGVLGQGYVGLPLAVAFAQAGFQVTGFDVDSARVSAMNNGICHIADIDDRAFQQARSTGYRTSSDFNLLRDMDVLIICVPTPLNSSKEPDISFVLNATREIEARLRPGQLIILESTTYPGTTEELLLPLLERRGLRAGSDFGLAFSPERIDPGNRHYTLRNTPKVVGGTTQRCLQLSIALYSSIVERVVPVSSTRAAEMVKLLENTFRAVNIGLANEFAQIAELLGLDIWEVIDAASTKPYGFLPFFPGPGLGGHCIPIDPLYLSWKLRALRYRARFIDLASEVNEEMPEFVVEMVTRALKEQGKCLHGSRILALGVAYKRDVSDVRESPALDVLRLLHARHAQVAYVDRYVPEIQLDAETLEARPCTNEELRAADCVVILTNHSYLDYAQVVKEAKLVVDTRNATGHLAQEAHVWRLARPNGVELPGVKGQGQEGEREEGAA